MVITASLLAGLASPALACGGLFCNTAQPVVQNAERIVFAVDQQNDVVDTHVQIFYEGPSDEFAWIVPVAQQPELFVSTQALFDQLAVRSGPIFSLNTVIEGNCSSDFAAGRNLAMADDAAGPPSSPAPQEGGTVEVISEAQVGPYETVTLRANSEDGLIAFLQENEYDLPSELSSVLAPYVAGEAYFVALKLQKDKEAGDITPLGMRYQGDQASIPIQLTSIAAADDLRLEVYVFADQRAVPSSYLHVDINHAAVDWWSFGSNYPDVITLAADEAGGHAFATDYFGPADAFAFDFQFDRRALEAAGSAVDWIQQIARQGVPFNDQLVSLVLAHVEPPPGIPGADFVSCPTCYENWNPADFDAAAATADLDETILTPLEEAEVLFDYDYLSRMTSSLSAVEMTIDPVFVMNEDLSGEDHFVAQTRNADLVFECGFNREMDKAPRRLELADGRAIDLPSQAWFRENDTTEFEFIRDLGLQKAQVIEQMGERGEGEVVADFTNDFRAATQNHNRMVRQLVSSCGGCSSSNPAGALGLIGLLALLGARRRR